nr:ribonuclease H-like domain, reverse transcriptase, RNA-dependent DNA polymerase [Tanacetum cinerariifolium]
MEERFKKSDLGLLAYYLGIEVTKTEDGISIKQTGYANKILKEARMVDCNETKIPMDPGTKLIKTEGGELVDAMEYRSLIGCLRYLLHTRPDLSYSVGLLSRFMQEPREQHMKAIRQLLRYIKGTLNFEFMVAIAAACQALWLQRLLNALTSSKEEKVTIRVENKSAIALMKNPVFHERSKHIDIRYHFIKECVEKNQIEVEHIRGDLQRADILTKALARIKFAKMRELLCIKEIKE